MSVSSRATTGTVTVVTETETTTITNTNTNAATLRSVVAYVRDDYAIATVIQN